MVLVILSRSFDERRCRGALRKAGRCGVPVAVLCVLAVGGQAVASESKHVIGATDKLTETESGLTFPARVDTGAQSCSLHVEKIEIEDEAKSRLKNVGKKARILLKDADGKSKWIEAKIADAVRVKSPSLKSGEYDRRYKVRLKLKWNDFEKTVLV